MKKIVTGVLVLCFLLTCVCSASVNGTYQGYDIVKVNVNGNEVVGDVPAINFNGRTMVPIRFVSEALGANVQWDGENNVANIINNTNNFDKVSVINSGTEAFISNWKQYQLLNVHSLMDCIYPVGITIYSVLLNALNNQSESSSRLNIKQAQSLLSTYTDSYDRFYKNTQEDKTNFNLTQNDTQIIDDLYVQLKKQYDLLSDELAYLNDFVDTDNYDYMNKATDVYSDIMSRYTQMSTTISNNKDIFYNSAFNSIENIFVKLKDQLSNYQTNNK